MQIDRTVARVVAVTGALAALTLAACGGGGGGSSSPAPVSVATATPAPTATPTPNPTGTANGSFGAIPTFSAAPIPITPASGGTSIALTSPNGVAGALGLGAIDPTNGLGSSYTVRFSNAPFAGVPNFAQTVPGVKGEILYLLAQTNAGQGVAYTGTSTLTLTLPAQYQGGNGYYIALYITSPTVNATWPPTATGGNAIKGTVNGTTVTFSFSNPGLQLVPSAQYSVVFYAV